MAILHCDSYIPGCSGDRIETDMSIFSPGGKQPTSSLSERVDLPSDIRLPCVNFNVQPEINKKFILLYEVQSF